MIQLSTWEVRWHHLLFLQDWQYRMVSISRIADVFFLLLEHLHMMFSSTVGSLIVTKIEIIWIFFKLKKNGALN